MVNAQEIVSMYRSMDARQRAEFWEAVSKETAFSLEVREIANREHDDFIAIRNVLERKSQPA